MKRLIKKANNYIYTIADFLTGGYYDFSQSKIDELINFSDCGISQNAYRILGFEYNTLNNIFNESEKDLIITKEDFINKLNSIIRKNFIGSWTKSKKCIPMISNAICIQDKDFSILINADVTGLDIENFYKKYKEDMDDYDPECAQYATTQQEILGNENGEITIIEINNIDVNSLPNEDTINNYLELCNISLF